MWTGGQTERQRDRLKGQIERQAIWKDGQTERETGLRDRWTDRQTQIDAHKQTEGLTFKFTDIHMDR
jgi:hypothetical protein